MTILLDRKRDVCLVLNLGRLDVIITKKQSQSCNLMIVESCVVESEALETRLFALICINRR